MRRNIFIGIAFLVLGVWGCADLEQPAPESSVQTRAPELAPSTERLRLDFLDVGQGDSILVTAPNGETVLVDAGHSGERVIPQLRAFNVQTIDLLVASHPHADHIGGMYAVLQGFPVGGYMDNGQRYNGGLYRDVVDAVILAQIPYVEPSAQTYSLGGATLTVLPPLQMGSENDRSVGLLFEYGQFRALLVGDCEYECISNFMSMGLPEVTVLKAAHHGSRNGVTPAWIAATRPKVVVVSVGAGNSYGHPDPWALRYYSALGAAVYRTDLQGIIEIAGAKDGTFEVATER